jgi:multidrug transporter EmrE-like cation transporter
MSNDVNAVGGTQMVAPGLDLSDPASRWQAVLLFSLYTAASVGGLVLMKYGLMQSRSLAHARAIFTPQMIFVVIGGALYVVSFLTWLAILSRYELSLAYPVAIGVTLAFTTIASFLVFAESLSLLRIAGILVIFLGIWLVVH